MTSRERDRLEGGDRRAVFDRDDHTCRRCGAQGDDDDGATLRCYPVGDVPHDGSIHERVLVTVCEPCYASLADPKPATEPVQPDVDGLFRLTRELTQRQGVTVSAVASFASLATSLPGEPADEGEGEAEAEAEPESEHEGEKDDESTETETETEYAQARREVRLAIDSVPARLDPLAAVDASHLSADVETPLERIVEAGTRLQTELETIVRLCEGVAADLDRCHACFEPLAKDVETAATTTDRCPTCATALDRDDVLGQAGVDGKGTDETITFTDRFNAINETLQDASDTTEELAESAAAVAGELRGE